ncbi:hypothetical protein O6H91_17G019300 [Diphasiastrum complanatum]|uniref:Uncharacterized protein n=2 Tax=Diphasiastrum complanatum TaxID=34168 RepID=A0ACC2B4P0_DIPCM|nr:hypothetical protein O6H91_Y121200 [Diphasiastrum complanatum]KAJ7524744.1 hypothetical protein O6H91_17G018900 [Diphasiastrum complanatum]KAJ7524749.1 hypothetical protein O6H91_17G019300 [Diphasiastrum complanatum]
MAVLARIPAQGLNESRATANSVVKCTGLHSTQYTNLAVAATRIKNPQNSNGSAPSLASSNSFVQPINYESQKHGYHHISRKRGSCVVVASTAMTSRPVIDLDFDLAQSLESFTSSSVSGRWRDLQGANNWEGLLDPIDPDLRAELIKYGEFAQVCYDAFDFEKHSKYCGSCKYNRRKVLVKTGLQRSADYEVTKYLYSTSEINLPSFFHRSDTAETWSRDSNWSGFVAVSTSASEIERLGRRDIVVAWRGTATIPEWIRNLQDWLSPADFDPGEAVVSLGNVKVERGFRSIYTSKKKTSRYNKESAQEQLLSEIRRLMKKYEGEDLSITVTGHSLGGALALLSAYDIAESEINIRRSQASTVSSSTNYLSDRSTLPYVRNGLDRGDASESVVPITVFTFAGPRVGNDLFRTRCEELGIKTLRVVNEKDVVPHVPGVVLNEDLHVLRRWIDKLPWTYSHVGVELALNTQNSPYLKWGFLDFASHHNLEAYLHLLDAYVSTKKRFSFSGHRDLALLNKFSELLKPEYIVPSYWWQQENKGLQKNEEGRWAQRDREEEDIPIVYRDD